MNIIPFYDYASWSEDVKIGNSVYRFKFSWNGVGEFWSMSILNTATEVIKSGIKVVLGSDLLSNYKYDEELPKGQIVPVRVRTESTKKIARGELEKGDVILWYREA